VTTTLGGSYYNDPNNAGWAILEADMSSPTSTGTSYDFLVVVNEFLIGQFPAVPRTTTLAATDLSACNDCLYFSTGCQANGSSCVKDYLAQAGSITVNTGTQSPDAGTFTGSLTNVRFDEWNFTTNTKVTNGQCVQVQSATFNATWP
jgi:hypothetical protein